MAARGVHRQLAIEGDALRRDPGAALAASAEAEALEREQDRRREVVVYLRHVDRVTAERRALEQVLRHHLQRVVEEVIDRVLVVEVSSLRNRADIYGRFGEVPSLVGAGEDDANAAVVNQTVV